MSDPRDAADDVLSRDVLSRERSGEALGTTPDDCVEERFLGEDVFGKEGEDDFGHSPASSGWIKGLVFSSVALLVAVAVLLSGHTARSAADEEEYNPRLFREVAKYLKSHYLDPERITPRDLMVRTFSSLENAVPEVYVDDSDADNPFLAVHVGFSSHVFNLNEIPNKSSGLDDAIRMLEEIFAFLQSNYSGDMTIADIQYAVLNGFLGGLDPHTLVFSPKDFPRFSRSISKARSTASGCTSATATASCKSSRSSRTHRPLAPSSRNGTSLRASATSRRST